MSFMPDSNVSTKSVERLVHMLRTCRPHQSDREFTCVTDWLVPLDLRWDKFGNGYKKIGKDPIVAWSCHTDTVHRCGGSQLIEFDKESGNVKLSKDSKSNCLGADDTAGMWIMIEMVKAKVPGLYLFHRAEEVGTLGSKWIAAKTPNMLEGVQACVAFDRRGRDSIITFQRSMRCCSDEFALSLGAKLGDDFKTDPTGLWTDSASYVDIVAECTNVSVGYTGEHSSSETLHIPTCVKLLDHMLQFDATGLMIKRKPGEKEPRYKTTYYGNRGGYGQWEGSKWVRNTDNDDLDDKKGTELEVVDRFHFTGKDYCPTSYLGYFYDDHKVIHCTQTRWAERKKEVDAIKAAEKMAADMKDRGKVVKLDAPTMVHLIRMHPEEVAAFLHDWGFDNSSLIEEIAAYKKVETTQTTQ